jgi:HD-like signal output (HDOD) protein
VESSPIVDPDRILITSQELPMLPTTLAQILQVTGSPRTSAADVETVLSVDAAITAKILTVANSATFAFKQEITTVNESIVALGLRRIRSFGAAMAMGPVFQDLGGELDGPRLWTHSLGCALWAQRLSKHVAFPEHDRVFTAGLMHDLGLIILNTLHPAPLLDAIRLAKTEGIELHVAERRTYGTDHAEVGSKLCAKWRVPMEITKTILGHHTVLIPAVRECQIVTVADHLANCSGWTNFPWEVTPKPEDLSQQAYAALNLAGDLATHFENDREQIAAQIAVFEETSGHEES